MASFFETRREELGLNRTQIAARLGVTAETIRLWEAEENYPSRVPVSAIATAYEISEETAASEIMSARQRIERTKDQAA